jgi:predicted metal-dependent phosphoesterase TrpH
MSTKPLKADLHIHTGDDPLDRVPYTAKELITEAATQGFDVLAITNHHRLTVDDDLLSYAWDLGILLIPGMEISIRKRHVLILNPPPGINYYDFSSLAGLNRPDSLVIAPHPYFPGPHSLNGCLQKNLDFFHALEYCHFYTPYLNFNRQVRRLSLVSGLPLLGNSDAHFLAQLGTTYSLISAQKDLESVFTAIRQGKVEVVSHPLSSFQMGLFLGRFLTWKLRRKKQTTHPPKDTREWMERWFENKKKAGGAK